MKILSQMYCTKYNSLTPPLLKNKYARQKVSSWISTINRGTVSREKCVKEGHENCFLVLTMDCKFFIYYFTILLLSEHTAFNMYSTYMQSWAFYPLSAMGGYIDQQHCSSVELLFFPNCSQTTFVDNLISFLFKKKIEFFFSKNKCFALFYVTISQKSSFFVNSLL